MTDIKERLRSPYIRAQWCKEAADRIEKLETISWDTVAKLIMDDMRECVPRIAKERNLIEYDCEEFIDAYCKDRGIK